MTAYQFGLEVNEVNLKAKVDSVESRHDLVSFINALRNDLATHPEEWQNRTLDDFLEAMSAWVQDMDGYYQNNHLPMPPLPSWKNIAEIMLAAKYYE